MREDSEDSEYRRVTKERGGTQREEEKGPVYKDHYNKKVHISWISQKK